MGKSVEKIKKIKKNIEVETAFHESLLMFLSETIY